MSPIINRQIYISLRKSSAIFPLSGSLGVFIVIMLYKMGCFFTTEASYTIKMFTFLIVNKLSKTYVLFNGNVLFANELDCDVRGG